ncbi:MAG: hypothetical protein ACM3ND_10425 [Acidobacteriota bacterium]|jgi:hypothetical protein
MAALPQIPSELPDGFLYSPEFISSEEENELLRQIANLEFRAFDFHGYIAKRRIVEYGFEYDFTSRQAQTASPTSISRCVQGTSRGMGRNSC